MTRQSEVLNRLRWGGWVDGPELANAETGGSEGLKRLRELRAQGHAIERRKHPDPNRDIWQYRMKPTPDQERDYRPATAASPPERVFVCPDHSGRGCVLCGGVGLVERAEGAA